MEKSQLFLKDNKTNKNVKRKTLNYIAFAKFLAMIKIIKWHIYIWKTYPINYGARMCEFLFIASGFLVGYNYYQRDMNCDYATSFKYTYKHMRNFYPLEFFNIIYGIYFRKRPKKFNLTQFEILLSNLLMIITWSRPIFFDYFFSGISWFVYDLVFCYLLVPLLLKTIKSIKNSLIIFFLVSLIRISIEELINNGALNIFDVDFGRGPYIRLLEFYMGMLLIPLYFYNKHYLDKYKNNYWFKFIFTIIEIIFPVIIYLIMIKYNNKLYRCYFVLIFCVSIFIIGYDYGFLSDLFAHKIFVKLMSCQMEMYLIQKTIKHIFNELEKIIRFPLLLNMEMQFLIKLLIIFLIGFLYKIFLKEKCSLLLDKTILLFKKLFI